MTFPNLILGILLSTLYGAFYHLWRGGNLGRLILYLILSSTGFWIGHLVADYFDWTFGSIGPLRAAAATIGSIVILGIGHWLSLVKTDSTP
jgi:hypothetical protein